MLMLHDLLDVMLLLVMTCCFICCCRAQRPCLCHAPQLLTCFLSVASKCCLETLQYPQHASTNAKMYVIPRQFVTFSGGNSYNQLAVLSTYGEDDLAAVYYYFRSLAVAKPFTISRENLVLLLEQIRVKYTKLPQRPQLTAKTQKVAMKNKRPVNILMQETAIRLAHLHGQSRMHLCRFVTACVAT